MKAEVVPVLEDDGIGVDDSIDDSVGFCSGINCDDTLLSKVEEDDFVDFLWPRT